MKINSNSMIIFIMLSICWISSEDDLFAEDTAGCYPDQKQITYQRHYLKDSLEVVVTINLPDLDPELYRPLGIEFDKHNNIYTLEYNNMIIYKINSITRDYIKFGHGKGKGPGELINPTDFKINDTLIYLPDYRNGKISIYSTSGYFVKDIKTGRKLPRNIVINDNSTMIVTKVNELEENKYFSVYDLEGRLIDNFGTALVRKHLDEFIYHESNIAKISDTTFVHVTKRTGYMGLYKNRKLLFRTTTVDGVQDPEFEVKKFMKVFTLTRVDNTALYTASGVKSNGKYVLVRAKDPQKNKRFFDLYNANNLQYIVSLKLPNSLTGFDINDKYIAGICDNYTKLVLFKLPHIATD